MARIVELTGLDCPELEVYTRLTEGQLRSRREPEKGVFIAESPKVIHRALDAGYEPLSLLAERRLLEGQAAELVERCGDIPVDPGARELLAGTALPIAEIAEQCGFPDASNFSRAFRRRYGVSPSSLRATPGENNE